jgi:predicted  nucleic acid-binding Zn-ribbon protein
MASSQEIIAAANETRKALFKLEIALEDDIDEMRLKAFNEGRALSDDEVKRRKELRVAQGEIRDAKKELAYVTLSRLDASDDVAQFRKRIDMVNQCLSDDLDNLKNIEKFAAKAAKAADKITEVVAKVASKAASMGII